MIRFPQSRYTMSGEAVVAPSARFTAEGQAAVYTRGDTVSGVMPSTGTATDIFAGFVVAGGGAAPFLENYTNTVETLQVSAQGTITLRFAPINAVSCLVVKEQDKDVVADTLTLAGKTLGGLTSVQGEVVTVTYKRELTYEQAVALQGNSEIGGYSGRQVAQIGLIKRAELLMISEFDTKADWRTAEKITLGAGGQITADGTGVEIPNAIVKFVPTHETPYLGIEFDAL